MMIAMNVSNWCYSIGQGFSQTTCAMIGKEIGAGNIKMARRIHKILQVICITNIMMMSLTLYGCEEAVINFYT